MSLWPAMTMKSRAKTNVQRSRHASAGLHATQVPRSTDMSKLILRVRFLFAYSGFSMRYVYARNALIMPTMISGKAVRETNWRYRRDALSAHSAPWPTQPRGDSTEVNLPKLIAAFSPTYIFSTLNNRNTSVKGYNSMKWPQQCPFCSHKHKISRKGNFSALLWVRGNTRARRSQKLSPNP